MATHEILPEISQTHLSAFESFFLGAPRSDTAYSLFVTLKPNTDESNVEARYKSNFHVYATRRRTGASDENDGSDTDETSKPYLSGIIGLLPMVRAMVTCPTWTHGKFVFEHDSPIDASFVPFLDSLMFDVFSLLSHNRSLSSLDIQFNRLSQVHVRPLLASVPSIETLILTPGAMEVPYHAESIAQYLSQNSVLKSCTLGLESCDFGRHPQFLGIIFSPFTTSVPSKANDGLKELVLRIAAPKAPPGLWEEPLAQLVRCNTSLQKLELLFSPDSSDPTSARKVWFNRELKEFGFLSSTAELGSLGDRVGIFEQSKPPLTILKLCPASPLLGEGFMQSLRQYLMRDCLSLKHVEVSSVTMGQPWRSWDDYRDDARDVELGTHEILESMLSSELRENTNLQSLVVGNWKLLRVGTEWQTSYGGPCLLFSRVVQEYRVKAKIR